LSFKSTKFSCNPSFRTPFAEEPPESFSKPLSPSPDPIALNPHKHMASFIVEENAPPSPSSPRSFRPRVLTDDAVVTNIGLEVLKIAEEAQATPTLPLPFPPTMQSQTHRWAFSPSSESSTSTRPSTALTSESPNPLSGRESTLTLINRSSSQNLLLYEVSSPRLLNLLIEKLEGEKFYPTHIQDLLCQSPFSDFSFTENAESSSKMVQNLMIASAICGNKYKIFLKELSLKSKRFLELSTTQIFVMALYYLYAEECQERKLQRQAILLDLQNFSDSLIDSMVELALESSPKLLPDDRGVSFEGVHPFSLLEFQHLFNLHEIPYQSFKLLFQEREWVLLAYETELFNPIADAIEHSQEEFLLRFNAQLKVLNSMLQADEIQHEVLENQRRIKELSIAIAKSTFV
jgi:hypothetical protein